MIGKISSGKGFGGTIAYVLGPGERGVEDRAEVLYHTMSSDNPEHWAIEMEEHARALNPDLVASGRSDLVIHVSLSAAPGEQLSKSEWLTLAHEYLQQMGWGDHDYIAVRHNDRPHDHIHLIVNRVGRDGETADLHNDYQRQASVLERIEKQFGLQESHTLMRQAAEADPTRAIASITQSHLTFEARDVQRYFTRLGFSDEQALDLTGRAMGSVQVLGTADGRYTTLAVQREVATLNDRFATLAGRTHGQLADFAPSVDPKRELSTDQQKAREAIAAGRDLTVIRGFAGAGKSALLEQARADLEQNGYRVIGAAPTGKASAGLHASSHIESSTIARLLGQLERGAVKLDSRTVLVIDEAGMTRLDDMSRLAAAVSAAGGRLVLVGDDRQLQAVGRGGALTLASEHAPATTLNQIWRQADSFENGQRIVDRQWMRDATRAFGEGRTADGIRAYADRGLIRWSASVGSSIRDMVLDYAWAIDHGDKRPDQMLAMAHKNEHVSALNHGIREALKDRGLLKEGRTYDLSRGGGKGDIELAVGDRIVLTKNKSGLGVSDEDVKNGMFGTVKALLAEDNKIDVQLDKGSFVRLDLDQFGHIDHGYASTIHKAQGASIQQTFVLMTRWMDACLAYVGLTRHTEWTRAYGNTVDFKDAGDLIAQLSKSNAAENFKNIIAASVEQKLMNVYGFDAEQVQRYMESHPGLEARLNALGIGPEHQGRYLQDVGNVLEKYGSEMNKIFERYEKILEFRLKPGEFKDTRNQLEKLRDNLWWSMVGPKTPTQYVLYQTARLAAFNVKFASAITYDIGMSTAKAALQLAGVAIKHGVPALADGMKKLGEAFSSASAKEKLVEQFPEKGSAAPPNKSAVPAAPDSKSTGVSPEAERKAEREAEKWSAFNPPDEKKYWQHLGEYERYSDMIRGVFDPVKHGLESWRGAAEQEAGREKDAGGERDTGNSGHSNARPEQERDERTKGTDRGSGQQQEGHGAGGGETKPSDEKKPQPTKSDQRRELEAGDKPSASPSQDNAGDKGHEQRKPAPAAGPSSSTAGPRAGGANESGRDKDAGPSSGKPEPSAGPSNTGNKGAEQGGTVPSQDARQAQPGSTSEKGANQNAGTSSGSSAGGSKDAGKPGQSKPGQQKPAAAKPVQDKPGSQKPGQQKPAQEKPGRTKPGQVKPGATKPAQEKPGQTKPGQQKPGKPKPENGQTNSNSGSKDKGYGRERYR